MYRSAATAVRTVPCYFCGQHAHLGERCLRCQVPVPDPNGESGVRVECPRCNSALAEIPIEAAASVHGCDVCGGIYAPARAWCLLAEQPAIAAQIRARMQEPKIARRALLDFLRCPGCGGQMERGRFAATTDIVVDVCALHGIWLDAGDLDALVNVTSEPERQRVIDEQMESLARQQRVTYAISSERDRIRGESLQRMYNWKVASLAVAVVLVLAMLGLASAKREVHDEAEYPRAAVAVAHASPQTPAAKSRSRSAER